ncbi:hypothetical protein AOQ84DRAFT_387328, partial [Glonium stellatum]
MAPAIQSSTASSLQRLLSLDKNFADLNEQIRQAAQIIGLPDNWYETASKSQPTGLQRPQNHARAEWVLRWILDKLKLKEAVGAQARANIKAWKLLEQTILLVPVPNAASLLRAADYPGILENALEENFGEELQDRDLQHRSRESPHSEIEVSESSTTAEEHPKPSKKRKRAVSAHNSPTKKVALGKAGLNDLFAAISRVLESVIERTRSDGNNKEPMVAEYMKMVLRTRTVRAAKLLRFWLNAVYTMLIWGPQDGESVFHAPDDGFRLSAILRVWELRTLDPNDTGASTKDFSTECLIPATALLNLIKGDKIFSDWENNRSQKEDFSPIRRRTGQLLEQLLVRHVFGPARAAFFADTASTESASGHTGVLKAEKLQVYLDPLYAELRQTAKLERILASSTKSLQSLFHAIPRLLEIAIRCSPRLTPKKKHAEMPWIQAAFVVLMECSGCPLHQPKFPVKNLSMTALCGLLEVIANQNLSLDSSILEDIFRFHSGMFRSFLEKGTVRWSLVARLVTLDPDVFLPKPNANITAPGDSSFDLSILIFKEISAFPFEDLDFTGTPQPIIERSSSHDFTGLLAQHSSEGHSGTVRNAFQRSILIPLMKAFARNRNFPGFVEKWHAQLSEVASIIRVSSGNQGKDVDMRPSIWEDEEFLSAIAPLLRSSLTVSQTSGLLEQHRNHLSTLLNDIDNGSNSASLLQVCGNSFKSACGSIIVIETLLGSIYHDEIIEGVEPQLDLLHSDIVALLEHDQFKSDADTASVWKLLSSIYTLLWTIGEFRSEDLTSSVVQIAQKSIPATKYEDDSSEHENISFKCRAGIEAFTFILTVYNNFRNAPAMFPSIRKQINQALSALLPPVAPPKSKIKGENISSAYPNIGDEPIAGTNELFRDIEVLLCRFPVLLEFVVPETRVYLFLQLCSAVLVGNSKILTERLLRACSEYVFSNLQSDVRNDLLSAFFAGIDKKGPVVAGVRRDEHSSFAASEMPYFYAPVKALPRRHREAVLDRITEHILEHQISCEVLQAHFALMAQLIESPNATARICTDPQCLFDIVDHLNKQHINFDCGVHQVFGTLVRKTLRHILADKEQERSRQFLLQFMDKVLKLNVDDVFSTDYTGNIIMLVAFLAVIGFEDTLKAGIWSKYAATTFRAVMASDSALIRQGGKAISSTLKLDTILDILTEDSLRIPAEDPATKDSLEEIRLFLSTWMLRYSATPNPGLSDVHASLFMYKACVGLDGLHTDPNLFLQVSRRVLQQDISAQEYRKVLDTVQLAVLQFDISTKLQILPSLLSTDKDEVEVESLHILHALVEILNSVTENAEQKQQFSAILPTLCSHLAKTHNIASFNSLLDSIQTILRNKPFLITQHGTEALLAALTTLASPSAPALPPAHATIIYT